MKNRQISLKRNSLSTALFIALLASAQAAVAQQQQPAEVDEEAQASETDPTTLDTITVTGSRIGRDTFSTVSPIQVITREETTLAGFSSTAGILQSTAVTGGTAQINNAFGGFVVDGGPGVNTVSLRGLGASRTLTLLNGRRVSPAGSRGSVGAADLNVLPNAMIERIEVLKDGASSIYGSDAIAGVVNIITRKNVDALEFESQYSVTEDGGGDQFRYSAIWGTTGDRFKISGSFEALNRNELALGDREWARCNTDYRRNLAVGDFWGSGDFIDPITGQPKCYPITGTGSNGVTINTIGTSTQAGVAAPGVVAGPNRFNRWRPNATVGTGLVGFEGVGGPAPQNSLGPRDTFDPRMLNRSLISPVDTKTAFVQGSYDLGILGDAEAYFEVLYNERDSSQVGYRQLSLDYAQGSLLLPAPLRALAPLAGPSEITNGRNIGVRAFIGFGNDTSSQSSNYSKVTAGLRGGLFTEWNYDFMVSQASSDADYTFESFLTSRLRQSLDVVAVPGGFACADASNGCIAAPALTSAVIGGTLPQNWVNSVFRPVTGNTTYDETTVALTANGSLFEMPYGRAMGSFGFEYRTAEIDDSPPIDSQTGNLYGLTSAAATRGEDSVWEVFGEMEVPLLSGVTLADELTVNVSARYTDYDSYGSDTTWKIGALWSPASWVTVRASKGTSYRAPALFEQFLGATSGFLSSQNDPCNNYGGNPGTPRFVNCASEGLSPDFTANTSVRVLTAGGADAGLAAETSSALTVGLILQPEFSSGFGSLSFAADYFDIQVDNGVARAGAGNILALCYDDPEFRAGGGFCRLTDRDPVSQAITVRDSYVNLAVDIVRGYDFTVRYSRDIGEGTFRWTTQLTRYLEQANKLFPDDPLDDVNGILNNPDYAGTVDFTYALREWTVRYGVEWLPSMDSYDRFGLDSETTAFKLHVPDYWLQSASVRYSGDDWSITGGVRNLANEEPPKISAINLNLVGNAPLYSGYDYVGRTFFVNIAKRF